mmetsp:Transcript_10508/g.30110  ORF Transcript_10508/g.30110 Transcript_10508/m.30110 type:complete len:217 (+) Transcript_10508:469-1119(+)
MVEEVIRGVLEVWLPGRLKVLPAELAPLHFGEPSVTFELLGSSTTSRYSGGGIVSHEALDEVAAVPICTCRELEITAHDILKDLHLILVPTLAEIDKRRVACNHFEDEDTERPPVSGLSVPDAENDLRREVFWCATECKGASFDPLRQPKVHQLGVSGGGDHDILRLEVTVGDVVPMYVEQSCSDACRVEFSRECGNSMVGFGVDELLQLPPLNEF